MSNYNLQLYLSEDETLTEYKVCPGSIINKQYLRYITGVKYEEDSVYEPPFHLHWYPYCNSYYNFTEDMDAITRVNNFLVDNPTFKSAHRMQAPETESDLYEETSAQIKYLSSKPLSFLILGKPGIGESELGRLLAQHWKCSYIDPKELIEEEIASNSRSGECIEFNLRCGRAIGVDVLLRLLSKRINSKTAQHRGFVISGFPLIANNLYEEDPVSSESAVFNVHEIFEEFLDTAIELGVPPQVIKNVSIASNFSKHDEDEDDDDDEEGDDDEEEKEGEDDEKSIKPPKASNKIVTPVHSVIDIGSGSVNIGVLDEIGTSYEEQINYIFDLCNSQLLIIYLSCTNTDVVEHRYNNRFDVLTKEIFNMHTMRLEKLLYTVFTKEPQITFNETSESNNIVIKDFSNNLKLPRDFPAHVSTTLEKYRLEVLKLIENHALIHDPQYFLRLDARYTPHYLFNVVKARLAVLPIHKVVVPKKMNVVAPILDAEDAVAELFNVDEHTLEECYEEFRKKFIVTKMFKWSLSNWGYQCPVALTEGNYTTGDPKFAVHYLNKLFFLSDENTCLQFCKNPRPYLLPPYPKPNCKIFIMGPNHSGKTAVAKCLAYLLDGEYVCPRKLEKEYQQTKQKECQDRIRSVAITEALSILKQKRRELYEEKEKKRKIAAAAWIHSFVDDFLSYNKLNERLVELAKLHVYPASFAIAVGIDYSPEDKAEFESLEESMAKLRADVLDKYNLDMIEDTLRTAVLSGSFDFESLIPEDLLVPIVYDFEAISIYHPFVLDYVRKALEAALIDRIDMELHSQIEMFKSALTDIESRNKLNGVMSGGWIIDGIPMNLEIILGLSPEFIADDIFILKDFSEDQTFLMERYFIKGQNDFRDYKSFFLDIGKTDAAWRSPSVTSTDSYKLRLVNRVMDEILDQEDVVHEEIDYREEYFSKHPTRELIQQYKSHLEDFEVDYSSLKQAINQSEARTLFTEISVTDKSIQELLTEFVKIMENKYRQSVHIVNPEDRIQEMEDFGADAPVMDEEGLHEEPELEDMFPINRRLGDTNFYCPVAFSKFGVFWRGNEDYAAQFENKTYLFSSEASMTLFAADPMQYLTRTNAPDNLPPIRVCVVGVQGSGKTELSKALTKELGLYYVNYEPKVSTPTTDPSNAESEVSDPDEHLVNNILKYWTEEPMKSTGFVIDGFPKKATDVTFMIKYGAIPDLIIELSCLEIEIYNRLLAMRITDWKKLIELQQKLKDEENRDTVNLWEQQRSLRIEELLSQKRDERYNEKVKELGDLKSQVSMDSVVAAADMDEIMRLVDVELPEPVFYDNWETLEDAAERFQTEIGTVYETDMGYLEGMREVCDSQQFAWSLVDANLEKPKVLTQILRIVDPIKYRNSAPFERCYDVTVNIAEALIETGYYFISRFGRTCPVQLQEKFNYMQMYVPQEELFEIYPMIYRNYIYYLSGKKNRLKFITNPLTYVGQNAQHLPLIPIKLAVIGPPKCGKTQLAERFQRELGLRSISVGKAARHVLKELPNSQLAKDVRSVLLKGWELTSEMSVKCILAMSCDDKCVTQGFILDGFPNNIQDTRHLAAAGLVPHIVIDVEASLDEVFMCLKNEKAKNAMPVYSRKFIEHRYNVYQEDYHVFRIWLDKEYQNITKVQITPCKWGVWNKAYILVMAVVSEIKHYYRNAGKDIVLSLSYMLVTPLEFLERQSSKFKNYCPGCLNNGKLTCGKSPPDRTGLVQYLKYYYWVCRNHVKQFRDCPDEYLPPYAKFLLPEDLPILLNLLAMPAVVKNNGYCVICYADNFPKRVIIQGVLDYACSYLNSVYIFDTQDCLDKFLSEPHSYFTKTVDVSLPEYPALKLRELPTLGLLEQHTARQLIRAVTHIGLNRSVVPGLDIPQSAIIKLGIYLKLHNPNTSEESKRRYQSAMDLYKTRCDHLIAQLAMMKRHLNPFLWYEEPLPKTIPLKMLESMSEVEIVKDCADYKSLDSTSSSSMIGLIDELLDKINYSPSASII